MGYVLACRAVYDMSASVSFALADSMIQNAATKAERILFIFYGVIVIICE